MTYATALTMSPLMLATQIARAASAFTLGVALLLVPARSLAQTTQPIPAGPSIMNGQPFPERYLNYGQANQQDLGESTRSAGLNPDGISDSDCLQDQTLVFPLVLSNFDGQSLQVWATVAGKCIDDPSRGFGGSAECWPVTTGAGTTGLTGSSTINVPVRVQDLVAWQNAFPSPMTYERADSTACAAQPSFTPVSFTIYFMAIASDTYDQSSTPYQYDVNVDLVGPPAPSGVRIADGDTLFTVNWMPNADSDTIGYDLYIDPPIGTYVDASTSPVLVCTGGSSGGSSQSGADDAGGEDAGSEDAADDADISPDDAALTDATVKDAATSGAAGSRAADATAKDATVASDAGGGEASCHYEYVSGNASDAGAGACYDPNLTAAIVIGGGTTVVADDASDDGGDASGTVSTSQGGICEISPTYAVPVGSSGLNVPGESTSEYTITGLHNGTTYTVVVAAVDAFGNVGPASTIGPGSCDYPAPVNDFWTLYRSAGGTGKGGLCALEAVGGPSAPSAAFVAVGAVGAALARRRRRRR